MCLSSIADVKEKLNAGTFFSPLRLSSGDDGALAPLVLLAALAVFRSQVHDRPLQ